MEIQELAKILLQRENGLKAIGATSLFIFGSRARGDHRPDSDLDLFIDYRTDPKRPSLLDIIAFEQEFERDTGIPVHMTMRDSLHPIIKKRVEKDSFRVF